MTVRCHSETITDRTPRYGAVIIKNILEGSLPDRPRFLKDRGLTDDLLRLVNNCWHEKPAQRPTMAKVACEMVRLAEEFAVSYKAIECTTPVRRLKDISAEIKRLGEHPVAGGGYCDLYLGERLGSEKVALKLVRVLGSTWLDEDVARQVS